MDISTFRELVDETAAKIAAWPTDLTEQHLFLGMPETGSYSTSLVGEELYRKICSAFAPGGTKIAEQCRELFGELIYELILEGKPVNPCCELLAAIKDATQPSQTSGRGSREEWLRAIEYAHISVRQTSLNVSERLHYIYPEDFAVAYAAARLRSVGCPLTRDGRTLKLGPETEARLVRKIENIIQDVGGLYMAQKIDSYLSAQYDVQQGRYHIIKLKPKLPEPQPPLIPIGYLFQLAVKHYQGGKSSGNVEQGKFTLLIELTRDYATILKVQDYSHFPTFPFVLENLIETLQKKALEDSIYKIPQVRAKDVTTILLGLIDEAILDETFKEGWTIRQAISVTDAILNKLADRGVSRVYARDVRKLCPSIPAEVVNFILSDVFSHPPCGANQNFCRPTDGPTMTPAHSRDDGANFSQLPLLRYTERSYILLNRSFCAGAFMEAIFSRMRAKDPSSDSVYLGRAIENFTRQILQEHDIESSSGHYWIGKTRWECDIVVETAETIIFIETKKKPLTRSARAGSDVSVVLDLALSLLDAQKQAGNHEVQLRKVGYLDIDDGRKISRIDLKGRNIERIALSLTDFGSFHDRTFIRNFMDAVTRMSFGAYDARYAMKFKKLNETIASLQEQNRYLSAHPGKHQRSYYNCWFFSVPQIMIILDDVSGAEAFRDTLWAIRGIATGQGDLW